VKPTAFVSHYDCARHDTGWGHPDHQGRLPALTRAVHADMLTLFDSLLDLEGRHATEEELGLWHDQAYLARARSWVDEAGERGRPFDVRPGLVVSDATWAASTAAAGSVLAAIETVANGTAANAFCPVRPPGRDATTDGPGRRGLVNPVAVGLRHLVGQGIARRVLVVEWGETALPSELEAEGSVRVARIGGLPADADDDVFAAARALALGEVLTGGFEAEFVVLSAGFDWVAGDPVGGRAITARGFHDATRELRELAEERAGGRLVSVLEGGYDGPGLGRCAVQHLRGLAGIPPA